MKYLFYNLILASTLQAAPLAAPLMDSPPAQLNWKTYNDVANHASQLPSEELYFKVDWKNSVLDAQSEAYQKDKPIVMILFFGDHRSNC